MFGCSPEQLRWRQPHGDVEHSPYWYITLPKEGAGTAKSAEELAKQICQRAVLVKSLIEVWGEGADWGELTAAISSYPAERRDPYTQDAGSSFRIVFDDFGVTTPPEGQDEAMEELEFLDFKGRVRLKDAQNRFTLCVSDCSENTSLVDQQMPRRLYFGREVARTDRSWVETYALRKRAYIGPTSMDNEVAMLMINQAKAGRGSLLFDPYVGTGSIIVAAGIHGASVVGGDIDPRVIKIGKVGKNGERVGVFSNFEQYKLQMPLGLIRMDAHRHPFREGLEEVFDAIVGDPPYGVRAGGRKSVAKEIVIRDRDTHIPSTDPYTLGECMRDLLDLSARLLTIGGRLVYFLPATPETYCEEEVPTHPALRLVANTEQLLTRRYSRRLITMEKVAKYEAAAAAAHHAAKPDPTMAIDRIHDIVYESLKDEQGNVVVQRPMNDKRCRGKNF